MGVINLFLSVWNHEATTMDQSPGENERGMKRWRCPEMRQKAEGIHSGWPQILTWEGNQW